MKKYILLLLLLVMSSHVFAQNTDADSVNVIGTLADAFTRKNLPKGIHATVELLRPDSTLICSTTTYDDDNRNLLRDRFTMYAFKVPRFGRTDFILRATANGYQPTYVKVSMTCRKKWPYVDAPAIYMRRQVKEQKLDEVVVTATKIKFYNRGDTIVYNADAFQLPEGSMLDALIKQLPGAELSPNGQIKVNGKVVESLLLNGRDFFKKDNTVLLDNLPAYMVSNVQVYKREDEKYRNLGFKGRIDEGQLVMDVKLKRQYNSGLIANVEGGYGSDDRYLARLFAMRYTDNSKVILFGNLNNVNARRKPDGSGDWGDFEPSGGVTTKKEAGLMYDIRDKYRRFFITGDARVTHTDNTLSSAGESTDFLPNGNVHNVVNKYSKESTTELYARNTTELGFGEKKRVRLNLSPWISYQKSTSESQYLSGAFSRKQSEDYSAALDSLASPQWTKYAANLIRRNMEQATGNSHIAKGSMVIFGSVFTKFNHAFMYGVIPSFSNTRMHEYNRFTYNYYANNDLQTDFRNRYDNLPQKSFDINAFFRHIFYWNRMITMKSIYEFKYSHSTGDQMRYRLDKLEESADRPLGWHADEASLADVLDLDNSYNSTLRQYQHTLTLDWQYDNFKRDDQRNPISGWYAHVKPILTFESGNYRLYNTPQAQMVKRSYVLPQLTFNMERHFVNNVNYIGLEGKYNTFSPAMTSLVDKTFSYDPLNVRLGNPDLEKRSILEFDFNLGVGTKNIQQLTMSVGWNKEYNALGSKYIYDKSTGVKTSQVVNVNGNWSGGANYYYWRWLDKKQRLMFSIGGYVQYLNYENFVGTSPSEIPVSTDTRKLIVYDVMKLDYNYKDVKVGLSCTVDYNNITSNRSDFKNLNTTALHYGANTSIKLPWSMRLSTDLTMFSRFGYESASINHNDLVWNARLSKGFMKNRIMLMVDAWDILGNLSNVDAGNNSNGSWEYYTNVIPRYIMARLVFKFVKQPKKK